MPEPVLSSVGSDSASMSSTTTRVVYVKWYALYVLSNYVCVSCRFEVVRVPLSVGLYVVCLLSRVDVVCLSFCVQ